MTALVLGIVGLGSLLATCGLGLVVSPIAWVIGQKAVREIDAQPGRWRGRSEARAGMVMGIIGTAVLALVVLVVIGLVIAFVNGAFDGSGSSGDFNAWEADLQPGCWDSEQPTRTGSLTSQIPNRSNTPR
jgi:hypothetical protein